MKGTIGAVGRIVVCLLAVLAAGAAGASAAEDMSGKLMAMENQLWQAWADGDGAPFEAMLIAEAVHLSTEGRRGKAEMIEEFAAGSCEVESFALTNPQVVELGEGAVLLTYEATQKGTCDGEVIPAKVVAASIWVERDGTWKNAYYQESPLDME